MRLLAREAGRSNYNHAKSEWELGLTFRPVRETLADTVAWYRAHGELPNTQAPAAASPARVVGSDAVLSR